MEPPWQRRLAVRVTKDAERHIRGGHPWVFDQSIESAKPGEPGDLAVIFDHRRRFLAVGLYDPTSPLAIRILHAGKPETIDAAWLAGAIAGSIERRRPLIDRGDTNAMRLVHGENDGLGGVVIDRYDSNLVIKLYSVAWLPWLPYLVDASLAATGAERIVLRLSRQVAASSDTPYGDGDVINGPELVGPVTFLENGLRFQADLVRGQKTGHFLDQRDNRAMIASLAADRDVLDVFACTGGFSVHAASGGARSVTSVDLSRPALDVARANMALNRFDRRRFDLRPLDLGPLDSVPTSTEPTNTEPTNTERDTDPADSNRADVGPADTEHRVRVGDAFAVMEELAAAGETFDLVIVDPPAFAQRKSQVARALSAYRRLSAAASDLIRPGGLLFQASCSGRVDSDQLIDAVNAGFGSRCSTERARTGQPIDHPIGFAQGAYLKAVLVEAH